MRKLAPVAVALLITALGASPAGAEKVGLQSERGTGERIGVQKSIDTKERLGLQTTKDTDGRMGLQTPEEAIDAEVADQLWDLNLAFDRDRLFVSTDTYKRLKAIAELLSEHATVFIYVQGLAEKGEKDPDGLDLRERRAVLAMTYLELFGVDRMVMELVVPGSAAEKRMTEQAARHRARHAAAAKEAGTAPVVFGLRGVRFGVVEQH